MGSIGRMITAKSGYKKIHWYFGEYEEIPEDWEVVYLKDLVEFGNQGVNTAIDKVEYSNDGFPLIKAGDVQQNFDIQSIKKISVESFKKIPDHQKPKTNDILYTNIGTLGKAALVEFNEKVAIAWNVFLIRTSNKINPKFLTYFLNYHKTYSRLISVASHTTMPFIPKSELFSIKIFCPSLQEQQKISSILSNVDSLITKIKTEIEQTKKLEQGLMQKLLTKGIGHTKFKRVKWFFGKEIEIPNDWKIIKLTDISLKIIDMNHEMPKKISDGIPFITTGYLSKNKNSILEINANNSEIQFVSKLDFEIESRKFNPEIGDILFSRYGTIGITKFINTPQKFLASYSIALIKLKKSLVDGFFLTYFLNSSYVKNQISFLREQSSNNNLHLSKINQIKIFLPVLMEQQKITFILSELDSQIHNLESKIINLETMKKGLMQKLLTGQIRVKV